MIHIYDGINCVRRGLHTDPTGRYVRKTVTDMFAIVGPHIWVWDGNGGNDILIGGAGNDLVSTSGSGRSLLIGSVGDDTLIGGSAGDVLIGGSTSYDAYSAKNNAALLAILREWDSADSYATRISKIDTGLAGGAKLSTATVHDDQNVDLLDGATNYPADPDWFWAGVGTNPDSTDAEAGEQVN